jgi:hypothetical protein
VHFAEELLLREPRTTKSFRDAGERIVRQESAISESLSRLLGAPPPTARALTTNGGAWDVRLAALATLAQYDALTFVGADQRGAYNLDTDPNAETEIRSAIDEVGRSAGTVQLRASVNLADGRIASNVLVTSFAPAGASAGALLAFRVGRAFAAVDAYAAVAVAEVVSLELAHALGDEREAIERRQALALYEIARHALFSDDLGDTLQSIAMVLASTLGHEAVHIWLSRPDRSLRRRAAYPLDPLASQVIWEGDDSGIAGAIRDRRLVRMNRPTAWTPSNTSEFLVAPLRGDPRPLGVLVLARALPYELDDIEMADVLATFIGRVVATSAASSALSTQGRSGPGSASDVESEEELAERD